jgi:hypothetical protein
MAGARLLVSNNLRQEDAAAAGAMIRKQSLQTNRKLGEVVARMGFLKNQSAMAAGRMREFSKNENRQRALANDPQLPQLRSPGRPAGDAKGDVITSKDDRG